MTFEAKPKPPEPALSIPEQELRLNKALPPGWHGQWSPDKYLFYARSGRVVIWGVTQFDDVELAQFVVRYVGRKG